MYQYSLNSGQVSAQNTMKSNVDASKVFFKDIIFVKFA